MLAPLFPLLFAALTDSVAPAPVATPTTAAAPVTAPACHAGPLQPGSWGLGFRVLGATPDIRLRRAVRSDLAIGLNLGWWGDHERTPSTHTSRREYVDAWGNTTYSTYSSEEFQELTHIGLRAELPLEWHRTLPHGLRTLTTLGLFYSHNRRESQFDDIYAGGEFAEFAKDETYDTRLGLTASLGAAWEFVPGLCLASSFGVDAYKSMGESYSSQEPYGANDLSRTYEYSESSTSGYGTSTWFGGIGLDFWF